VKGLPETLSLRDLRSDNEVRWCPGCGDYAILRSLQATLASLGVPPEQIVFVGGAGCAGRFPFYLDTYGLHTFPGSSLAFATGMLAQPELSVWVVVGDGDGLGAGASHLLHALRRNVDVKILLINNETMGLASGVFSPTSPARKITRTSPRGNPEQPLDPVQFALTAGATLVARTFDVYVEHAARMIETVARHKGAALLEILQNCNIFNDLAFSAFTDKHQRADRTVDLVAGEPLLFGGERSQGLAFRDGRLAVVDAEHAMTWNPAQESVASAVALAELGRGGGPFPLGVFREVSLPSYQQELLDALADTASPRQPAAEAVAARLESDDAWDVKG
jgi:2-oxoglutarate ferredoxin oxidoreductase subunit beta